MGYLLYLDYKSIIQNDNLQQIISKDDSIRLSVEAASQEEAISYLIQKYDIMQEMKDSEIYKMNGSYSAGQTLQLSGTTYSSSVTYVTNDIVNYNSICYGCSGSTTNQIPSDTLQKWLYKGTQFDSGITYSDLEYVIYSGSTYYTSGSSIGIPGDTGSTWIYQSSQMYDSAVTYVVNDLVQYTGNCYVSIRPSINVLPDSSYWILLGNYEDLYNVIYVYDRFDYYKQYNVTDKVFYGDNVYECILNSQNIYTTNIQYWSGSTYTVDSKLINNTLYFKKGDVRSQQMVGVLLDITIYNILSRVSPRNIPEIRVKRKDDAITWLKMASMGKITPTFLNKTPRKLTKWRMGSTPKNNNNY